MVEAMISNKHEGPVTRLCGNILEDKIDFLLQHFESKLSIPVETFENKVKK